MSIARIIARLEQADRAYYLNEEHGESLTDADYDAMKQQVRSCAMNTSASATERSLATAYLRRVGATVEPTSEASTVAHAIPMGSQQHLKTPEEFLAWWHTHRKPIILTWKMDGSSIAVTYMRSSIDLIATRGDGIMGHLITANGRLWKGLPDQVPIPGRLYARVEVILTKPDAAILGAKMHDPSLVTGPLRNIGNGIIMRKSVGGDADNRLMTAYLFDLRHDGCGSDRMPRQQDLFAHAKALGFQVVESSPVLHTESEIMAWYDQALQRRSSLPFLVDGLVAYIDDRITQEAMGFTDGGTRPLGQAAWKFPPEGKRSIVRSFDLHVGKTGDVVPTVVFDPIQIGGSTIDRATMTGIGRIEAMGVDMGDEILVVKANDVIPYVERVTTKHSSRKHFVFPSACPSCGHSVSRMGESIVCTSLTCPGKIGSRIEGWISTAGMDGLGPAMVQTVMRHGIVRRCADLYAMTVEDLSRTPYSGDHQRSVGDKIAKKIVASIAKSTGMPLARALGGSGIDSLGERQAQKWLDAQSRSQVTWQEVISSIRLGTWATWLRDGDGSGIGPTKANAMATDAASCVDDLEALWSAVKPEPYVRQAAVATPGGFVVCLTGSFDVPKSQIAAAIAARGHTVVDAVTSACTHVVQADPSIASGKSKAAVKRGIPVITWDQMRALL